jgi:glyoxylase-like metal-dependent hydrolase (beta-lactamase superfamily II)
VTLETKSTATQELGALTGYPPDSIDVVLCTHLHLDHVGWNTRWGWHEMGAHIPKRTLPVRSA